MASITKVLAFDCSTSPASVALVVDGACTARSIAHGQQAAQLVSLIDTLLRDAALAYTDLDALVSTIGPGSFTGLRIALATLHGLALANPTPIRLTTSTHAVARAIADRADAPAHFTVALDAGKRECFAQEFTWENGTLTARDDITLHPAAFVTECALPCFSNLLPPEHTHYVSGPDAAILARYAEQISPCSLADAMPYYIRPADAKLPSSS